MATWSQEDFDFWLTHELESDSSTGASVSFHEYIPPPLSSSNSSGEAAVSLPEFIPPPPSSSSSSSGEASVSLPQFIPPPSSTSVAAVGGVRPRLPPRSSSASGSEGQSLEKTGHESSFYFSAAAAAGGGGGGRASLSASFDSAPPSSSGEGVFGSQCSSSSSSSTEGGSFSPSLGSQYSSSSGGGGGFSPSLGSQHSSREGMFFPCLRSQHSSSSFSSLGSQDSFSAPQNGSLKRKYRQIKAVCEKETDREQRNAHFVIWLMGRQPRPLMIADLSEGSRCVYQERYDAYNKAQRLQKVALSVKHSITLLGNGHPKTKTKLLHEGIIAACGLSIPTEDEWSMIYGEYYGDKNTLFEPLLKKISQSLGREVQRWKLILEQEDVVAQVQALMQQEANFLNDRTSVTISTAKASIRLSMCFFAYLTWMASEEVFGDVSSLQGICSNPVLNDAECLTLAELLLVYGNTQHIARLERLVLMGVVNLARDLQGLTNCQQVLLRFKDLSSSPFMSKMETAWDGIEGFTSEVAQWITARYIAPSSGLGNVEPFSTLILFYTAIHFEVYRLLPLLEPQMSGFIQASNLLQLLDLANTYDCRVLSKACMQFLAIDVNCITILRLPGGVPHGRGDYFVALCREATDKMIQL